MFDLNIFNDLFGSILRKDAHSRTLTANDIRESIRILRDLYGPRPESLKEQSVTVPNYNVPAHRCAYLHKYAAFHTALAYETMLNIINRHFALFENIVSSGHLNLCSLGGGPGSDALGVLVALHQRFFNSFQVTLTLVDIIESWRFTFSSVSQELLKNKEYGCMQKMMRNCSWDYLDANLLSPLSDNVAQKIGDANLITMVKFVSAAACDETGTMISNIFNALQEGALVLFIDNAGGRFDRLMHQVSKKLGFILRFEEQHYLYNRESLKCVRFGYPSCFETRVTICLLQKPFKNSNSTFTQSIPKQITLCPSSNQSTEQQILPTNEVETVSQRGRNYEYGPIDTSPTQNYAYVPGDHNPSLSGDSDFDRRELLDDPDYADCSCCVIC